MHRFQGIYWSLPCRYQSPFFRSFGRKTPLVRGKVPKMNFVVDLGYATPPMREAQIVGYNKSICSQLSLAHGYNHKHAKPSTISITDINSEVGKGLMTHHNAHSWQFITHYPFSLGQLIAQGKLEKKNIVYLSPDATNVLERVNENHVYVIGAIADRSVKRYVSMEKAATLDLKTARLPIKEHIPKGIQKYALNMNTVINILLDMQMPNAEWKKAFRKHIPGRYYIGERLSFRSKKKLWNEQKSGKNNPQREQSEEQEEGEEAKQQQNDSHVYN